MCYPIINEIILRNEVSLTARIALLSTLIILALISVLNENWFVFMQKLTLLPIQRFNWESEKYSSNLIFRISSLVSSSLVSASLIITYLPELNIFKTVHPSISFFWFLIGALGLLLVSILANKFYFSLHKEDELGEHIIDYQNALNQWLSFIVGSLILADVFYLHLHSILYAIILGLVIIYFLLRLFGTILMLQNNFEYPILSVFVYLCTFEIVPALVISKILFVNS